MFPSNIIWGWCTGCDSDVSPTVSPILLILTRAPGLHRCGSGFNKDTDDIATYSLTIICCKLRRHKIEAHCYTQDQENNEESTKKKVDKLAYNDPNVSLCFIIYVFPVSFF